MANSEHLAILKQGVEVWNQWRKDQPEIEPDLKGANLKNLNLKSINLNRANLIGTNFTNTILIKAHFKEAKLGLNSKLFLIVFLTILSIEIYFYHLGFLFTLTVYLITLLLCLLRNFTANNKPFLPNSENLVSQSERKLWQINKTNHHIDYKKFRSSTATAINNLFYVSLFSFIPLLSIAGWLEPSLRLFSDNGMLNTLYFFSALVVTFYLGFLGTIGFDINKLLRWLFFTIVHTSKFNNADLTDADFSFARITNADFNNAILTRTNLYNVKGIKQIRIDQNYIHILKPLILNLVLYRKAENLDLEGVDLSELNLSNTNFSHSNLSKVQLIGSNLANCTLTGACIKSWEIDSQTNIANVVCDYIYLQKNKGERRPHSKQFLPGEFTKRYQKVLKTVDLYFDNGIDWEIFLHSFQKLREEEKLKIENENTEFPIIQTIENKNNGSFLIKVGVASSTNQAEWEDRFWQKYRPLLEAKDQTIGILKSDIEHIRKKNTKLLEMVEEMAKKENRKIYLEKGDYLEQSHSGSGDNVGRDKSVTNNTFVSPELKQIGDNFQLILDELKQVYNSNTEKGREKIITEAIQKVENNTNLVKKVFSMSEQALFAYLQARFISPLQSAFLAGLKAWKKTEQ